MPLKLAIIACLSAILYAFFFPGAFLRLLRRLGLSLGSFGRTGKELLSGEEVQGSSLAQYEAVAGKAMEEKLRASYPPDPDGKLQEQVIGLGARLAAVAERRELLYRFQVVEGEEPAAFSVPGGAVFLTRPLVDLCDEDDQQLACVMAHEIAHIDRRHAVRHLARTTAAHTGLKILTLGRSVLLGQAVGALESLIEHGYSSREELEADRVAVALATAAGFDPRAYIYFLQKINDRHLGNSGYFKTHPPIAERIARLA